MPAPIADPARCDVPGCGAIAANMTDGSEKDPHDLGRKAIPLLNLCSHHPGWAFSNDAVVFTKLDARYAPRGK